MELFQLQSTKVLFEYVSKESDRLLRREIKQAVARREGRRGCPTHVEPARRGVFVGHAPLVPGMAHRWHFDLANLPAQAEFDVGARVFARLRKRLPPLDRIVAADRVLLADEPVNVVVDRRR